MNKLLQNTRNTIETFADVIYLEVKANTNIYAGQMVALENGKAIIAKKVEDLIVVGRAEENVLGGYINVKRGVFLYDNDTISPVNSMHILK